MDLEPRKPPQSIESEAALLGALMLDAEALDDIGDLSADDFYEPRHRAIFAAVRELHAGGELFDTVVVGDALAAAGKLDAAGGFEYLADLDRAAGAAENVKHYARAVRRCSMLRRLVKTGSEIADAAYDFSGSDAAEVLAEAEARVFALSERSDGASQAQTGADLARDFLARLEARSRGEDVQRVHTGLADLDKHLLGFEPGQLVVIGARPSVGKSALALGIARHVALQCNLPVAFYSMEMTAAELTDRLVSLSSGVALRDIQTGTLDAWGRERVDASVRAIQAAPLAIDDDAGATVSAMRARCRRIKRRMGGLRLVVVDYLQLIEHQGENRNQQVSAISRGLKLLAKEVGAPVIALSQLNRESAGRSDARPRLSDLRESGAIEQDADCVMLLHRPDLAGDTDATPGVAELIVAKQRNGPANFVVRLAFVEGRATFGSLARAAS
ncbi:MAG: replicative DNA helicase [Thiohalocapsa sp.]|nr:replicative DNA helicase [Thiohalocapsa sp.]